jgi:hypothetical protein
MSITNDRLDLKAQCLEPLQRILHHLLLRLKSMSYTHPEDVALLLRFELDSLHDTRSRPGARVTLGHLGIQRGCHRVRDVHCTVVSTQDSQRRETDVRRS